MHVIVAQMAVNLIYYQLSGSSEPQEVKSNEITDLLDKGFVIVSTSCTEDSLLDMAAGKHRGYYIWRKQY